MANIKVYLLGRPYVEMDGERVNFPYKKAEGFFYYLCVKKTATREEIISVLWGADNENVGRKNLREAVYQIKKLLGKEILVTVGHTSISLNPECMPEIDWDNLNDENLLDAEEQGFLSHFMIKNSYEFEEWISAMQEQYNKRFVKVAREKLYKADATKNMEEIQKYSNILLKQDPYNEKLYYEIMDIYALNGNYNMAIKLYYDLEKILADELGVEPSSEVTELFHRIFNVKGNTNSDGVIWNLPFWGRNEEIYQISECIVGGAKDGCPRCVAIGGEDGVGKSALLDKAMQMVKGYQMIGLYAACYREESEFFLRPWSDIFWEVEQRADYPVLRESMSEEKWEQLEHFFKGKVMEENGKSGALNYQVMEQAVIDMFRKILEHNKVVLFFDDIQWMDQTSLQLLNRLLLTFGTHKILLMCTFNQEKDADVMESLNNIVKKGWLHVINLFPFNEKETNEILCKFLPELSEDQKKRQNVYRMTEGNAFFLMESINLMKEKGYTLEKSQKTNNVIKARLVGLPEQELEVLNCMSLFPEKVSIEEIELLHLDMDRLTLVRVLEKLQERHLIKELLVGWNVYYKFEHQVFKEYIYDKQSVGKKRAYHQILAEYYEAKATGKKNFAYLPMTIHHYEKCHNLVKVYQYKIAYLKEYYTIVNENFPVLHWEMEYGDDNQELSFHADEILRLAEEVIRFEGDSHQLQEMKMEMYYVKGRFDIAIGEYETGLANIKASESLAETLNDNKARLNNYKQMIFYGIQIENLPLVKKYVEEGMKLIDETDTDEKGIFMRLKGWYLLHEGRYEEARSLLTQAREFFENRDGGRGQYAMNIAACYNYIGDVCREMKEYQSALSYYKIAIEKGTEKVVTNGLGQFYSNVGQMYYFMEKNTEARTYLEKAIACFEKNGYYWGLERAEAYMALVLLRFGEKDQAKKHYKKAVSLTEKMNNPTTVSVIRQISKEAGF